jgi:hypothetical protein
MSGNEPRADQVKKKHMSRTDRIIWFLVRLLSSPVLTVFGIFFVYHVVAEDTFHIQLSSPKHLGLVLVLLLCFGVVWIGIEFLFWTHSRFLWLPVFVLTGMLLYVVSMLPFVYYSHFSSHSWSIWQDIPELYKGKGGWGLSILIFYTFMTIRIWKSSSPKVRKLLFRGMLPAILIVALFPLLFRLGMVQFYRATLNPNPDTVSQLINDLKDPEFGFGTSPPVLLNPYGYSFSLRGMLEPHDVSYIKKIAEEAGFHLTTMECLHFRAQLKRSPVLWEKQKLQHVEFIESRFAEWDTFQYKEFVAYWKARLERYGNRNFIYISRPLFSRNRHWSVLVISRTCGNRCAYTYCMFVHLDKDGVWRVRCKRLISMS